MQSFIIKYTSLLLCVLSTSVTARTYSHIKDPLNLLSKLDAFVGRPSFEKAFKCERVLTYEMNTCARYCEPFVCSEVCDPTVKQFKIQIRDCQKDSVSIFNLSTNQEWFKITREGFAKDNFIRFFLAAPWTGKPDKSIIGEEVGKNHIELSNLKEEKFTLKSGKTIDAIRLFYIYYHFDKQMRKHVPSSQSVLVPRFEETAGLHLDHIFYEVKMPLAKVVEITDP